jgi:hypothetical protein
VESQCSTVVSKMIIMYYILAIVPILAEVWFWYL